MHIRLFDQVLHVVARRAKAPVFCLGQVHVDLVHLHLALVGVEAVFRGELRKGGLRRSLVLQGVEGDVGPLPRFIAGTLAPEHRLQLHPRLRERVVGYQTRIGQGVEQVTPVDFLNELQQLVPFSQQVVHLLAGGVVLRFLLQPGFGTVQFVLALLVAAAFFQQLFQRLHQARAQAIGFTLALHEVPQTGANYVINVTRQQCNKTIKQALLVLQHIVAEYIWEAVLFDLLHRIQGLGGVLGQCLVVVQARDPVVHAEGKELAAQHFCCLKEHARRRHFAAEHLLRFGKEIEVVRAVAVGQGRGHGVAITTASAANSLQETGLIGRHGTQQNG